MNHEQRVQLVRELRKRYNRVPLEMFFEVMRQAQTEEDFEIAAALLEDENEKGREAERRMNAEIQARIETLTGSTVHRELKISVPPGVDLAHVQALLVYGFIDPNRRRIFSGRRPISRRNALDNASRKLIFSYSEGLLLGAEEFLLRHRVILPGHARGDEQAYSLNLDPKMKGITREGKEIIAACLQFIKQYKTK